MENMDKGLTVPKWVLINRLKTPQMPQNLSAQFVCPNPKVLDFDEKNASSGVHTPCSVPFCWLWQYGLSSFQVGGTELERFLPKNQHTQRKLLNFENWCSGELSKIGHHFRK